MHTSLRRCVASVLALLLPVLLSPAPAAHEAPARPAAAGVLTVATDPPGAAVYIDGQLAGKTPLNLERLAAGDHRVRLVKAGYLENGRVVSIGTRQPADLRVKLTADPGGSHSAASMAVGTSGPNWLLWGAIIGGGAAAAYFGLHSSNKPPALTSITAAPASALAGATKVAFTAQGATDPNGDKLSYSWDFGDNSALDTGEAPTHTFTTAGTFTVKLTLSDGKKTATSTTPVVVKSLTGTWTGNIGGSTSTFFTLVFTQTGANVTGTYTDTLNQNGTNVGTVAAPLAFTWTTTFPTFSPLAWTGIVDAGLNRITGTVTGYASGQATFFLNRQ